MKTDLKQLAEDIKKLSNKDLNKLLKVLNETTSNKKDFFLPLSKFNPVEVRLSEIKDFLADNKTAICEIAIASSISGYGKGVTWLDNVTSGDLKLSGATYSSGTVENPANIEDSVLVWETPSNWRNEMEDEDCSLYKVSNGDILKNGKEVMGEGVVPYKDSGDYYDLGYDRGRNTPLTEEEIGKIQDEVEEYYFIEYEYTEILPNVLSEAQSLIREKLHPEVW